MSSKDVVMGMDYIQGGKSTAQPGLAPFLLFYGGYLFTSGCGRERQDKLAKIGSIKYFTHSDTQVNIPVFWVI